MLYNFLSLNTYIYISVKNVLGCNKQKYIYQTPGFSSYPTSEKHIEVYWVWPVH